MVYHLAEGRATSVGRPSSALAIDSSRQSVSILALHSEGAVKQRGLALRAAFDCLQQKSQPNSCEKSLWLKGLQTFRLLI